MGMLSSGAECRRGLLWGFSAACILFFLAGRALQEPQGGESPSTANLKTNALRTPSDQPAAAHTATERTHAGQPDAKDEGRSSRVGTVNCDAILESKVHQTLCAVLKDIKLAPQEDLLSHDWLIARIQRAGLFYDARTSPQDGTKSIYGSDAAYMHPDPQSGPKTGLWQTPQQLTAALLLLSSKGIGSYLEVGPATSWTSTLLVTYLSRFGLTSARLVDAFPLLDESLRPLWKAFELPIEYTKFPLEQQIVPLDQLRASYDLIFIDGDHSWEHVNKDFNHYGPLARILMFHDINDHFCVDVVRFWKTLREQHGTEWTFHEFTMHPNSFRLMGLGIVEKRL